MANNTSVDQTTPSFLVDGMLGRLARWLRILGYDTILDTKADDWTLARRARTEARLLLTRDRQLATLCGPSALLVEGNDLGDQVRQVVDHVGGPSSGGMWTRCPVCNGQLVYLSRQEARGRVPAYVYQTQNEFRRCPDCSRLYWRGSHWDRMSKILDSWQDLTLPDD